MQERKPKLNEMEQDYFNGRTGEPANTRYVDRNTWRAWRSSPKKQGAVKEALLRAFDEQLIPGYRKFINQNPNPCRGDFDRFHKGEVDALYGFLQTYHSNTKVHPASKGDYHGYAYNSYAKLVNLAYCHIYRPEENPSLLHCLHVPLDSRVNRGINKLCESGIIPRWPGVDVPSGGMGQIKSKTHYYAIQNYLRSIVDEIPSEKFKGNTVSPLAFEVFWSQGS